MILRALCLRPMRLRPWRALATVLGVAIGAAAVVSTLMASRAAVASLDADVEVLAGRAQLEVTRPDGVALTDVEALRELSGQALFVPVIDRPVLAPALGDFVRLLGVDLLLDHAVRGVELDTAGGDLDAAREALLTGRGAALARSLARELDVTVGDELELVVRARTRAVTVVTLFEPGGVSAAWERLVLVDIATAQELLGRFDHVDRVELVPRITLDERSRDALAARVRAELGAGYRVKPPAARRDQGRRMVRALEFNLTALAGVSILVGIVLVATTLATSVVQRRSQIALLRSLGASRAQIATAVLVEAAAIGLVGGALGVLLGTLGAHAAIGSVRATVATVVEGAMAGAVRLDVGWAALGLAIGVVTSMVAAVLPLVEALRTAPLQGLRHEHPEARTRGLALRAVAFAALVLAAVLFANLPPIADRPVWALFSALAVLSTLFVLAGPLVDLLSGLHARTGQPTSSAGLTLRLAQAALGAGRQRATWAAGAVGVAVGLAVAMTTMVGSFRRSVVDWTEQAMPSDLFVRPLTTDSGALAGRIEPEVVELARETFGTENVDPFYQSRAYYEGDAILLGGAEFAVVAREGGVPFLDGRASRDVFRAALARGGAVVNEPFARHYDVEVGDSVELGTPAGTIERDVVGVYRDYSGHTGRVVLDRRDYLSLYSDEGAHSIAVFVGDDQDVEAARTALAAALGGRFAVELLNNREVRAEVLQVFERTFAVTVALQLIAAVVAGIAVVCVLTALVQERRRELAVVRVLGGSRRQVASLVLGEALLLGLTGALGGLAVGLAMGWVLVAVVNVQSFGWTLDYTIPASLWVTILAIVPACLLAGLFPALLSLRAAPVESLRATG